MKCQSCDVRLRLDNTSRTWLDTCESCADDLDYRCAQEDDERPVGYQPSIWARAAAAKAKRDEA